MLEFQCGLGWSSKPFAPGGVQRFADALVQDPLVHVNPGMPDEPLYIEGLFKR